ncbi:AraC family transcriptional regulator [Actinomadura sp. NBRC 104425]|uniref:helix-turn-helix domain-containing protein n=1 Tax=Actinomadura sp. NBRC 104425 TaxID=3032204 RepID=UPI0024A443EE|nr:helix-turn-helix domain-containing protein [Actinomadura sp. NBRC 104425]GLZ12847.1 AraC family transcriptional regulator [Actinomadura sp. NBRC 104425]
MQGRQVVVEDAGGWRRVFAPPHPVLRPFLRRYEGFWDYGSGPGTVRTLPLPTAVVIVNLGAPLELDVPGDGSGGHTSFAAGMQDGHGAYRHAGRLRGVQLNITPLGAYTLFGVPMARLTNAAVELADLLGPGTAPFVGRLAETPAWADRFDLLDGLLLRRLDAGPSPAPEVRRAFDLLAASGGAVPVADLADEVGWSRKHLNDRFKQQVGLPPKVMSRVLRFHRALCMMIRRPRRPWADVAHACGYYDQPHLIREFRALAGCTPTELLAARTAAVPLTTAIPNP